MDGVSVDGVGWCLHAGVRSPPVTPLLPGGRLAPGGPAPSRAGRDHRSDSLDFTEILTGDKLSIVSLQILPSLPSQGLLGLKRLSTEY